MSEIISFLILVSLLSVFIFILAGKFGIVEWYQLHRRRWMPDGCNFCLFFWLGLILLLIAAAGDVAVLITGSRVIDLVLSAAMAAPLSLFLYNKK